MVTPYVVIIRHHCHHQGVAIDPICQPDGRWTEPSGCSVGACGPAVVPEKFVKISCNTYNVGDTCHLACAPGYKGSSTAITCTSSGLWTEAIGCDEGTVMMMMMLSRQW